MNYLNRVILDPRSTAFLGAVARKLEEALPIDASGNGSDRRHLIIDAARHLIFSETAKRIRPLLVYYSGRIFREDDRKWIDIAVAAELIHSASLLHDDVVDHAEVRRHRPTANMKWGNTVAILSGDLLLTVALRQLKSVDEGVVREAIEVVGRMTEATINEVLSRGRLDVSLEEWREMAAGKTGSLFEWCTRAAVWETAHGEVLGRLTDCTRRFALAFQMMDDLKDVVRTASGKDAFSDLRNKELNSAVILAAGASDRVRDAIACLWEQEEPDPEQVQDVASRIAASNAVERVKALVRTEVSAGVELLGEYRETPGGERIAFWADSLLKAVPTKGAE
ncbi:MAG: polyprenyl synthetase family protein [Pseudomonadota bacterium]